MNQLLRLLVDNELHRLAVWDNPANDVKRGVDHFGQAERGMLEVFTVTFLLMNLPKFDVGCLDGDYSHCLGS